MSELRKFCNVCGNLYSIRAVTIMYGEKDYFTIGICSPACNGKVVKSDSDGGNHE